MLDRFTVSFSLSVIEDGTVLVLALMLITRQQFGATGYWLLGYAISAMYGDYNFGIEMRDKALGTSLATAITFPTTIDFILDLCGRVALFVAIWTFFVLIRRLYAPSTCEMS